MAMAGCATAPTGPQVLASSTFEVNLCLTATSEDPEYVAGCPIILDPWQPEFGASHTWPLPANVTGIGLFVESGPTPASVNFTITAANLSASMPFTGPMRNIFRAFNDLDVGEARWQNYGAGRVCDATEATVEVSGTGSLVNWEVRVVALVSNLPPEGRQLFGLVGPYCEPTWRMDESTL